MAFLAKQRKDRDVGLEEVWSVGKVLLSISSFPQFFKEMNNPVVKMLIHISFLFFGPLNNPSLKCVKSTYTWSIYFPFMLQWYMIPVGSICKCSHSLEG